MNEKSHELTHPQKSIFLTQKFYPETNINNICGTCFIHSIINFELLKKAITLLIENHEVFKIRFKTENNNTYQFISNIKPPNLDNVTLVNTNNDIQILEQKLSSKIYNIYEDENLYDFKIFKFPNNHGGYVINIHHLLSDSWTLGLIAKKIVEYYNLLLNDDESLIDESQFTYTKYINDEKTYLESDKYIKDKQFWDTIFNTIPEIATIPSKNYNKDHKLDCSANRNKYKLTNDKTKKISNFCKKNNTSIFNFFMSIYSIYISKISGVSDFTIGTPILNRSNFIQKNTLGMFISTLPIRYTMNFDENFTDFSKKTSINFMSMLRHQKFPYTHILENLRKKQYDLPNLYNILISYQITKTTTDGFDYDTRWDFNNNCADDIQIHILDLNDSGSLDIYYDYKCNKYLSEEIDQIHERILYIIDQILDNPKIKLSKINIITVSETKQILNVFNNTLVKYDNTKTIIDLFEDIVAKYPLNTAIICNKQKLTYEILNKKANQLAHYLKKSGIKPNDLIGIMTFRSINMVVGLLAILKLGAAYIPIDPTYPSERVNYLIENSNAKLLLIDETIECLYPNILKLNINIDNEDYSNLNTSIPSNSLMYMIYTSGSTGKPKGVMITHKNVHNFLQGIYKTINFSGFSTIVSLTTMCFDIFGLELWGGLLSGKTVVIATEQEQNNCELLNNLCLENNVEILQTTPSRMSFFLKDEKNHGFLNNLKIILLGGESLPQNIVDKILNKSKAKLYNMYGPTETTIWSTIQEITDSSDISIGKPISNTTCYITDKTLQLVPPYVPGTLYIGGDGVSNGYWHLPDLTLEKFINSPYKKDELIYNTGDLAYYDEFGKIYHLGRNDFQVKLRGYRIELGEIENKISNYPNIKSCIVIVSNNFLICYYNTLNGSKIKENDLISYLLKLLPDYMVPTNFVYLDEFPLTPNGKLDKKSFPKIEQQNIITEKPTSSTEKLLCAIISRILKIKINNINHTFISIGLDSLGIIQAQTELLSHGINVTTHYFYKYPTIKKLAEIIDKKSSNYNEKSCEIPDKFKHYPDDILSKISTINVDENTLGNVFLTGANGFIGIHILHEILTTTTNIVYCLVRGKTKSDRISKLSENYLYYFNTDITEYLDKRIFIINGDMSVQNLNMTQNDLKIIQENVDTIINTAAIVKHYGNLSDFEKNNIEGTKNIIDLAFQNNIKLVHLSSISVSGNYLVKQNNKDVQFSENDLYIGQHYEDNNYVYSKMESEKLILQYMSKGLKAQIHRIGIVAGRYCDGIFQKKINENAFYSRIKSIIDMNAIPDTMTLESIEFTPVDLCAKSIITLAKNSVCDNKIYNIYNHNLVKIFKLIETLKKFDIYVQIMNNNDFNNYILNLSKTKKNSIKGIINDLNYDENNLLTINYDFTVDIQSKYTTNYLHLLNFDWPIIDEVYLTKIIQHMKNVGFIK